MFSVDVAQDFILGFLRREFAQPVLEIAIPDTETVVRNENGKISPYIAVQFGDLQQIGSKSIATVKGHGYHLPVYVQPIGPTAEIGRKLMNKLNRLMLDLDVPGGGSIQKRAGGMMYPIHASNGAYEAFVFPASFAVPVELIDI